MTVDYSDENRITHDGGPYPEGGTHMGRREDCPGPSCGPIWYDDVPSVDLPGMWDLSDFTGGEDYDGTGREVRTAWGRDPIRIVQPEGCTCSFGNPPELECPHHGECASYGHVGRCEGCPPDLDVQENPAAYGPVGACEFLHRHVCAGDGCDGSQDAPGTDDPFAPESQAEPRSPGRDWFVADFDGTCERGRHVFVSEDQAAVRENADGDWECQDCVMHDDMVNASVTGCPVRDCERGSCK